MPDEKCYCKVRMTNYEPDEASHLPLVVCKVFFFTFDLKFSFQILHDSNYDILIADEILLILMTMSCDQM